MESEFAEQGTRNVSPYLSMADAIGYRASVLGGENAIREYNNGLVRSAVALLVRMWGTRELNADQRQWSHMANVVLPTNNATRAMGLVQPLLDE